MKIHTLKYIARWSVRGFVMWFAVTLAVILFRLYDGADYAFYFAFIEGNLCAFYLYIGLIWTLYELTKEPCSYNANTDITGKNKNHLRDWLRKYVPTLTER